LHDTELSHLRVNEIAALLDAAFEGDPAAKSYEEIILAYPSLEAIAIHRMAHVLYEKELPLIPRIMTEWAHSRAWPNSATRDRALSSFLRFYNRRRPHTAANGRAPITRVH